MPSENFRPSADDALMAIDGAISNLLVLRQYVAMALGGTSSHIAETTERAPGPTPTPEEFHAGHHTAPGGFGEPDFCLDCDSNVDVIPEPVPGVSPETTDDSRS
jgi:hypothetical protein